MSFSEEFSLIITLKGFFSLIYLKLAASQNCKVKGNNDIIFVKKNIDNNNKISKRKYSRVINLLDEVINNVVVSKKIPNNIMEK